MDPLLALGREKLVRVGDPTVPDDEQEQLRAELWELLRGEDGSRLTERLASAFNRLSIDEVSIFPPSTYRWYLDWISDQDITSLRMVSASFLSLLWLTFTDPVLRMRVTETAVAAEEVGEVPASDSLLASMFSRIIESHDEPRPSDVQPVIELTDALMTLRRAHALRVLGACLRRAPSALRESMWSAIRGRLHTLDPGRAEDMERLIREGSQYPGRERPT